MTDDYELHERYAILLEENNVGDDDKTAKFQYWRQAQKEITERQIKENTDGQRAL